MNSYGRKNDSRHPRDMDSDTTRRSPLHDAHAAADARFTDFGGWEMPVSFAGIQEEHHAVRDAAGVFDVSHMGEVEVTGHDEEMTDRWIEHRDARGLDAAVENATEEYAMLAVQGPDAPGIVAGETEADVEGLGFFDFVETAVAGVDCLLSRSGYTGEEGFELITAWEDAGALWEAFVGDGGLRYSELRLGHDRQPVAVHTRDDRRPPPLRDSERRKSPPPRRSGNDVASWANLACVVSFRKT